MVVTGAGGFVGRALCDALAASGAEVVGYSRRSIIAPARWTSVQAESSAIVAPPDATLVHLAEPSNMDAFRQDPALAAQLREAALALTGQPWRHAIYASSAAVYGDLSAAPRREEDQVAGGGPYADLKLANEQRFLERGGSVLRLANVYGTGMSHLNVLSDILKQVGQPGPLRVRDTGPVRDFVALADVVAAFALVVHRQARGVFNVGTGIGTSIGSLARMLLGVAGEPDRAIEVADVTARASTLVLDASALRSLGWHARVSLHDGLAAMMARR